ncbi:Uma2 family endonuclease [Actinomycetes bacterium KLBMP 9797]
MTITEFTPKADEWTVSDLEELPPGIRAEVHGGNLVIMSPARLWHQHVERQLCNILECAGRFAFTQVGVFGRPNDTRIAEVGVFHEEPDNLQESWHDPAALALVVEVWSPSSEDKDRNPRWYLARGIEEYWLAEPIKGEKYDALVTMCRRGRNLSGFIDYVEYRQARLSELERDGLG